MLSLKKILNFMDDQNNKQSTQSAPKISPENNTGDVFLTPYLAGLYPLENENDIQNYSSKFEFLSPAVEKIIFNFSTAEFIEEQLGVKFNLSGKQKEEVANIIRGILLGDIFIGDFIKAAQTKLNLDENKAKEITSMIVAELFPPAVESIRKIQRLKFPLKIQELAKSRQEQPSQQPTGMGEKRYIQEDLNKIPLTQPTARPAPRPEVEPHQNIIPPSARPVSPPPISAVRPASPQLQRDKPPLQMSPRPPQPNVSRPAAEDKTRLEGRQFKVPDLGQILPREETAWPSPPPQTAQKSLEEELQKVASVIDLRSGPKNQ